MERNRFRIRSVVGLKRKSNPCVVHHQSLRLIGLALICADLAELSLVWPSSLLELGMVSGLVGAGGEHQRRGSVHAGQRHGEGSVQQCGELRRDSRN